MSSPTRFPSGVVNVSPGNTLADYIAPDPTKVLTFWDDFAPYTATDWVITATSVGAGTSAAAQRDDGVGGIVRITTAANEDDSLWLQQSHDGGTNDLEAWQFQSGKKAWFKAKFLMEEATQQDIIIGIHKTQTDPIDTAPTDGIWFQKDDGDADLDFHIAKNSVFTTASAIAAVSDATSLTVGFYWDGVDTIEYFVDDVRRGTLSSGTIPDDEYMAISFGTQNGAAAAKYVDVDYIFAAVER